MRTVIVGAGPTGLFIAIALARRGRDVVVIDRDPGPVAYRGAKIWDRKGVMQFHHAHTFRGQVIDALQAEMPDVFRDLIAAGAQVAYMDSRPAVLHCRRMVFERVLRGWAAVEPGVRLAAGHVDRILVERGRVRGLQVRGRTVKADLVIDASGRTSRLTASLRPPAEGGPCGSMYVGRQYRLRDDATPGPVNSVIGLSLSYPGYWAIAFLHDNRTFSVTLVHDGEDRRLRGLRHAAVFDAAVREIPGMSEWIESDRSVSITPVLPGGRVFNTYRGQLDAAGRPMLAGLISVGDAVCTTTPLAGRGVALSFLQARALVAQLDKDDADFVRATIEFDRWCAANVKPWFEDHNHADTERLRRWSGSDVDLSGRLPSDVICAAAEADARLLPIIGPYLRMDALPSSLAAAEPRARQIYAEGWRPVAPPGPSKEDLAELCEQHSFDRQLCASSS